MKDLKVICYGVTISMVFGILLSLIFIYAK